jgi:hypothetical protein
MVAHGKVPNYGYQYLIGGDFGNWPATTTNLIGHARSLGMIPTFGNNLRGLVEAINYTIRKCDPGAFIGWQVNDWALRDPLKDTDTIGVTAGRASVVSVGNQVGAFVNSADIGYRADFVAFDQWGQDFGILRDPNPAGDMRYRNAGQCSGLQAGGEGPCWEGRQGRSSVLAGMVLLLDVLLHGARRWPAGGAGEAGEVRARPELVGTVVVVFEVGELAP